MITHFHQYHSIHSYSGNFPVSFPLKKVLEAVTIFQSQTSCIRTCRFDGILKMAKKTGKASSSGERGGEMVLSVECGP